MHLPILLAVDDDRHALDDVVSQLVRRYARDYRIEARGEPDDALRTLRLLAEEGVDVALVLAASSRSSPSGHHLLELVRQLHPHARRVMLVPANVWSDPAAAGAIRDSMALGRIDSYVLRPAGPLDEVFHEAISSFLLEWARDRRVVPQTVHIVGETWSGRAYELRAVFEQCSAPHSFCLAASEQGQELLAKAGPDPKLPLKGKDAYIAGGGNSAGQAALHLARYARRVTLVVRAPSLGAGMSHYLVRAIEATPNVEVRASTTVVGGGGDGQLQQLVLRDNRGEEVKVAADALFVLIGARPHLDWLPPEIARDEHGFLLTGAELDGHDWPLERRPLSLETSMPGVLAAGDARRASVKRVASAVGEGAIAVQLVHSLLADDVG